MGSLVDLLIYSTDIVTYLQSSGHWGCSCDKREAEATSPERTVQGGDGT